MAIEFKYPDGTVYNGMFDDRGLRMGIGSIIFGDKTTYKGSFESGLFTGKGSINFPDGASYAGEFWQGKFYGYGVFVNVDGMKYEGQFKDGEFHGYGLVTYADGTNGFPKKEGIFDRNVCKMICDSSDHVEKAKSIAQAAQHIRV
ncbi:MORN repeat-containing protein 4 [Octopus sinensis]|uniref:MORN repeat-containing protein 4 n=1 Tax=Octopus sinensis TaxID=2607531 RepID=A0A6P7T3P3_9MOLL|nr:MORN repeat-containing protein 4 [Octopus sinensis]